MAELGSDFAGIADIDANLSRVSGRTAYLESIARRLTQPNGGIHYAPDVGYDTRRFLNGAVANGQFLDRGEIEEQAKADERTRNARASFEFDEATRNLTIRLDVEDDDGPFALVVNPADLTAELLET